MFSTSANSGYFNIIASSTSTQEAASRLLSIASAAAADTASGTFVPAYSENGATQVNAQRLGVAGIPTVLTANQLYNIQVSLSAGALIQTVDGTSFTTTGLSAADWVANNYLSVGAGIPIVNSEYWSGQVCGLWVSQTIPSAADQLTIVNFWNFLYGT